VFSYGCYGRVAYSNTSVACVVQERGNLGQQHLDYSRGDRLIGEASEIPQTFWSLVQYVETYFISECRDTD